MITLQLSGIALDADCPAGMTLVFERLRRASGQPSVRAVLALRAARWGLAEPQPQQRRRNQGITPLASCGHDLHHVYRYSFIIKDTSC